MFIRIVLLAIGLVGLSGASQAAGELTQTLKRINDTSTINLGYRVDQTPMSYDRGENQPAGYSVELCNRIADGVKQTLGRDDIRVKYHAVTAENRFESIRSGKIDILCGATTRTLSRAEIVGFTQSTFVTGAGFLSYQDQQLSHLEDLVGKRVAVVVNTTTIVALNRVIQELGLSIEVVEVDSTKKGMDLLERKEVDAFAADEVVLIGQVISRGGRDTYALSEELFSFEPFALAIPRGDPDFQLVADRVLSRLNREGGVVSIYKRWFGSFGRKPPAALRALYQLNSIPE